MILRPLGCLLTDEQRVTSVREEAERLQPSCTAGGNRKWCDCHGKHGKQPGVSTRS